MSVLRQGLVPRIGLPQRFKKVCGTSGKVKWHSERDALIIRQQLGGFGSVYKCRHCGSWHITRRVAS